MNRCQAKAKSGDQCKNNAISRTNYCYLKSHCKENVKFYKRIINFIQNNWLPIGSLLLAILMLVFYLQDKNKESFTGVIESSTKANTKYIAVGATRFIIDAPDNVFLREGNDPLLSLKIVNNKLFVTTYIRDSKGELVAELVDNEWKLNINSIFDRNYNDQALEVRDGKGEIILQIVNFGDVIHFAGVFNCKNGKTFALIPTGESGAIMEIKPPGVDLQNKILPVFTYPSDLHFGECPGFDTLRKLVNKGGPGYRLGGSLEICK